MPRSLTVKERGLTAGVEKFFHFAHSQAFLKRR